MTRRTGSFMRYCVAVALIAFAAPIASADVGVAINVGQPGFFGQIDIGNVPGPNLIYARPMVIQQPPGPMYAPIYLHVPPYHARHWRRFCGRYHACDRPVYFVNDDWYNRVYVPRYREMHGDDHGYRRDDHDRRDHRDDHHDHGDWHDHGDGRD